MLTLLTTIILFKPQHERIDEDDHNYTRGRLAFKYIPETTTRKEKLCYNGLNVTVSLRIYVHEYFVILPVPRFQQSRGSTKGCHPCILDLCLVALTTCRFPCGLCIAGGGEAAATAA